MHGAAEKVGYYLQGQPFDETLYYDGGDVTVTVQGSEYDYDAYYKSGNSYIPIQVKLYKAGSSRTYRLRRNDSPIYSAYQTGTYYSGGLFANFEEAIIETQEVKALTV